MAHPVARVLRGTDNVRTKRRARGTSNVCLLCTQGGSEPGHSNACPLGRKRKEGEKIKKKLTLQGGGRTGVDDSGKCLQGICWGQMPV
jgi:hypothetical protein